MDPAFNSSAIEAPEPDGDYSSLRDVPHITNIYYESPGTAPGVPGPLFRDSLRLA